MKQIRTISIMLTTVLITIVGLTSNAFALTAAGDTISNRASLTYEVGGVPATDPIESSPAGNSTPGAGSGSDTNFLVDSKVDLTMTAPASVTASGADEIMVFTITNEGNETQTYQLRLYSGVDATDDVFDMTNVRVYLDVDKSGDFSGGDVPYVYAASGGILGVTPDVLGDVPTTPAGDNTIQVLVYADVPAGQATNDTAEYTLKAESFDSTALGGAQTTAASTATNGVGVVLADAAAGAGTDSSSDAARDGDFLATGSFTVQAAALTIQKSYTVVSDPINGAVSPQPIPGAVIRYTISITNSGAADADNVVLTDDIPANTLFSTSESVSAISTLGNGTIAYDTGAGYGAYVPSDDSGAGELTDSTVSSLQVTYATIPGTVSNGGANGTATVTFAVRIQ